MNRFIRQASSTSIVIDQGRPASRRTPGSLSRRKRSIDAVLPVGNSLYQVAQSTTVISRNLRYIAFTYPRSDDPTIVSVP